MAAPSSSRYLYRSRPKVASKFSTLTRLVLLPALAIFTLLMLWNPANASSLRKSSEPAFSLLVKVQFTTTDLKQQFLKDIKPVADHVKAHEPDTLSYEVLLSDNDPLQVLILERYKNKDIAFLEVHKSSAPFLAFRPKLQALQDAGQVTISGNSYVDAGVGFGDRS